MSDTPKPIQPAARERLRKLHEEATPPEGKALWYWGPVSERGELAFTRAEGAQALLDSYPAMEEALRVAVEALEDIASVDAADGRSNRALGALRQLGALPGEEGS